MNITIVKVLVFSFIFFLSQFLLSFLFCFLTIFLYFSRITEKYADFIEANRTEDSVERLKELKRLVSEKFNLNYVSMKRYQ